MVGSPELPAVAAMATGFLPQDLWRRIPVAGFLSQDSCAILGNVAKKEVESETFKNPFRSGAAVTGEYFTDRREEVGRLAGYMESGHNAVIIAPRRYGKSSVVREAMAKARRRGVRVGFANLQFCVDEQGVLDALATAITMEALGWMNSSLQRLQQQARSVKPSLDFEVGDSGKPVVRLRPTGAGRHASVREVLGLLEEARSGGRQAALAVDEIQRVADINPKLAGLFKGAVDELPDVGFVIAGSQRRMMEQLVQGPNAPMTNIGTPLPVGTIPRREMVAFLVKRSQTGGRPMLAATAERIYELGRGVPYYVQELARHAFAEAEHEWISEEDVTMAIEVLTEAQEGLGIPLYNRLTLPQKKVLRALAVEPTKEPGASEIVARSGVPASTIRASLEKLEGDELVELDGEEGWRVANPFFQRWLLRSMGGAAP